MIFNDRLLKDKGQLFLSVIIPAYNEANRLPKSLERIIKYLQRSVQRWQTDMSAVELIVVDDGSTDETIEIAKAFTPKIPNLQTIHYLPNRGKGYAVKQGMLSAKGKWRLFSDADLSTPIEELDKMLPLLLSGENDIAIASRSLPQSELIIHQPFYREMLGRMFNWAVRLIATPGIHDTQCGFKLFRGEVADHLFALQQLDGFAFDVEILYLAKKFGYKIAEVPVQWVNDPNTKVKTIRHGLQMLKDIVSIRLKSLLGKAG